MTAVRFYLVRHAHAERLDSRGDAARPLTREGRARFEAHARMLAPAMALARIATSPLARARETADLLSLASGAPVTVEDELRAGETSGRGLLDLGRRLGDGTALVGHNPEIADAASRAAGHGLEVSPGAIVAVDSDGARFRFAWMRAPA